ncbi:hypothetical protein EBR25_13850, partial [bacterium]|nr:hypothetical protein [bacterium]
LSKERSKGVDRDKIVRSASDSQPAELEKGNRSNSIQKVFKALRSMRERSRLKGAVRKALKELENRGYISQRVDYVTSSCLDRDFCSRGLSESAVEGRFSGTLSDARGCGVLITRYFSTPLGNKLVHYCKGKERE